MGLPKVREGTYSSLAKSLDDDYKSDYDFIERYLDYLNEENPIALAMILKFTDKLRGKKLIAALMGMCLMYKLLESEAQALDFEAEMEASNGN